MADSRQHSATPIVMSDLDPSMVPLGATVGKRSDGVAGTWFRVDSATAESVEVCLFDGDEETRVEMDRSGETFRRFMPNVGIGTCYGYRVNGPWDPGSGNRCNPHKLLLDPRARLVSGMPDTSPAMLGHDPNDPMLASTLDSAPHTMRSVVTAAIEPIRQFRSPVPMADTIIYETHVRGISARHPDVPEEIRGTYAGLAHPAIVDHLANLGVTAVELLPVQQFVDDTFLLERGLRNYWGYNTIGFFAPHAQYASGDDPCSEFEAMVSTLHSAGLEVILDVVYNHTAEGSKLGPTLSFRGLDNAVWYRLDPTDRSEYVNWTGTGNTIDIRQTPVISMVIDSLRLWVEVYGIDGFRFDLATVLGRTTESFDRNAEFLDLIGQDPVLANVKLIAEPWDVGPHGYQVGAFPPRWSEWNDQFRDGVRDFWRAGHGSLPNFATRLTGSSDIFGHRRPAASINFITSHDGFTLADLVSYNDRHNDANGEGNRDGHADNRSWNSGVEGTTEDEEILAVRSRRIRSLLATLLLAQGVPMLLGGDELGRTQGGNNNAYNQNNETSWYDWSNVDEDLYEFVGSLIHLRRRHSTFRRTERFGEHAKPVSAVVGWFSSSGNEMTSERWKDPSQTSVGLYLNGVTVESESGKVEDDDFLIIVNGGERTIEFPLPRGLPQQGWVVVVDSGSEERALTAPSVVVDGFGMVVLCHPRT